MSDYLNACAAYRVGYNRFIGSEIFEHGIQGDDEPTPLQVSALPNYLEGYQGNGRLVKMLQMAYRDLCANINNVKFENNINIYIVLPSLDSRNFTFEDESSYTTEELIESIKHEFVTRYINLIMPEIQAQNVYIIFGERVDFLQAFALALRDLNEGKCQYNLMLAVDCLLNNELVEQLLEDEELKTAESPNGFIPGEGAVAMLLSSSLSNPNTDNACALDIRLDIGSEEVPSEDDWENEEQFDENEESLRQSWQGNILSLLTARCVGAEPINTASLNWFSDMNGSYLRACESGMLQVKLKSLIPELDIGSAETPVANFGEMGLVTGGLYLALIAFCIERDCLAFNYSLITLSEVNGKRGVMLIGKLRD